MAKKIKNQERCSLRIAGWVIGLVFAVYMLVLLVPYIYALFSSLTDFPTWKRSIFPFPVNGLKLDNYLSAWNDLKYGDNGIPQMILNSLWFAGGSAVLGGCGKLADLLSGSAYFGHRLVSLQNRGQHQHRCNQIPGILCGYAALYYTHCNAVCYIPKEADGHSDFRRNQGLIKERSLL